MIESLRNHVLKRLGGHAPNLDFVLTKFKPISCKRNHVLLHQGLVCKQVYYVVSGCLQVFGYDNQSREVTTELITEDNWCSDLISFGSGEPASQNIRCLEESKLLMIDKSSFEKLMHEVPQFGHVYKQIIEQAYANSLKRINSFVAMTASDRIDWLEANRPELIARIPGKLVASYLGIHKDVYSRLRKKRQEESGLI